MNDIERINNLIAVLRAVQQAPEIWASSSDHRIVQIFLNGFAAAGAASGLTHEFDVIHRRVRQTRGWGNPASLIETMQERRLPEQATVTELIALQIKTWQQVGATQTV